MINESSMNIFSDDKVYNGMKGVVDIREDLIGKYTSPEISFSSTLYPSNLEVWLTGIGFVFSAVPSANPPQIKVTLKAEARGLATNMDDMGWVTCGTTTVLIEELVGRPYQHQLQTQYGGQPLSLPFRTVEGAKKYKVEIEFIDGDGSVIQGHLYGNLQFDV